MPIEDVPGTRRVYPRAITLDNGTAVSLRLMSAADAPAVIAFARSLPADDLLFLPTDITSSSVVAQWVKNLAAGRTVTVIAEAGDEMAGYASLHHHETSWQRHLGEIRIQAGQRYRSQGLGRGLAGEVFALATELGLRNVAFVVDDLQADVDRLAAGGYGLVGGIGQYEDIWRMAYVRGPDGIIVALAQRID